MPVCTVTTLSTQQLTRLLSSSLSICLHTTNPSLCVIVIHAYSNSYILSNYVFDLRYFYLRTMSYGSCYILLVSFRFENSNLQNTVESARRENDSLPPMCLLLRDSSVLSFVGQTSQSFIHHSNNAFSILQGSQLTRFRVQIYYRILGFYIENSTSHDRIV